MAKQPSQPILQNDCALVGNRSSRRSYECWWYGLENRCAGYLVVRLSAVGTSYAPGYVLMHSH